MSAFDMILHLFLALILCIVGFIGVVMLFKKQEEITEFLQNKEMVIQKSLGVVLIVVSIIVGLVVVLKH